jgi:hypothetical protein
MPADNKKLREQRSNFEAVFLFFPYHGMVPRPIPNEVGHTYLESRYRGDRHDAAQTLVLKTYDDTHQIWGTIHSDMHPAEIRREMQLLDCLFIPVKGQIQDLAKPTRRAGKLR